MKAAFINRKPIKRMNVNVLPIFIFWDNRVPINEETQKVLDPVMLHAKHTDLIIRLIERLPFQIGLSSYRNGAIILSYELASSYCQEYLG